MCLPDCMSSVKSSSARQGRLDAAWTAFVAAAALAIASVRPRAAWMHSHVRETSDMYALPPPPEVLRMSMGYRAALADVLWAQVLVSQGLHNLERRHFEHLTRLLDTINARKPTFREPYLMADALVTFQEGTP